MEFWFQMLINKLEFRSHYMYTKRDLIAVPNFLLKMQSIMKKALVTYMKNQASNGSLSEYCRILDKIFNCDDFFIQNITGTYCEVYLS